MENRNFDVIIVGGAVMGSSVAYHLLAAEPKIKVAVLERDPTYTRASTALSLGGVRVQFSLKENILISHYAQEFFSRFEDEVAVDGETIDRLSKGWIPYSHRRGGKGCCGKRHGFAEEAGGRS